ncbi:signal peptidase I [Streptomyces sp. URMC 123]|uniref:signal peptidase I n=1 Tax=Streptomyces sp. URMC 123 TaxID=3423403 RepID=UPI003F1A5F14
MDTDAQLTPPSERARSSDPAEGPEERARSARFPGLRRASGSWRAGPRRFSGWRRTALLAAVCALFVALLSAFVVQPFLIPSGSMENTLRIGDRVLVNKLAYRFGDQPRRGDMVVFDGTGSFVRGRPAENPVAALLRDAGEAVGLAEPDESDYVKRVIGIGGDRVTCCDQGGRMTVNGVAVSEGYLYPGDAPSRVPFDIVVPEGRLWVMGDHRGASRDSRDHLGEPGGGMVPVAKVIGRVDWIGWPFDRWTSFDRPGAFDRVPEPPGRAAGGHG